VLCEHHHEDLLRAMPVFQAAGAALVEDLPL